MKQWGKLAAGLLIIVILCSLCTISALADNLPGGDKESRANEFFAACLREHPEYVSAVCFDLNGDGVNEMLASESDRYPTRATLYALSTDGKSLVCWKLFSRFSSFDYDSDNRTLTTDSSGTGVNEFCIMSLYGNDLVVRHIGKNLEFHEMDDRYYDYTETVSGLSGDYIRYSFGCIDTTNGGMSPDMDILEGHRISSSDYQAWHDYIQSQTSLEFAEAGEILRSIEPAQDGDKPGEESIPYVDAVPVSIGKWGDYGIVGLHNDGTVSAAGFSEDAAAELESWRDIVQIVSKGYLIVGLKEDGSTEVFCSLSADELTDEERGAITEVESWRDMKALTVTNHRVIGLKKDGTIAMTYPDFFGAEWHADFSDWTDLRAIVGGSCIDGEYLIGIKNDGSILVKSSSESGIWYGLPRKVAAVSCSGWELLCLQEDGTVTSAGFDGVWSWKDIVQVCSYDGIALGLRKDGTLAFDIHESRLSLNPDEGARELESWHNIRRLFIGKNGLIIGIKEDGKAVLVRSSWAYQDCDPEMIKAIESWSDLDRILYCGGYPTGILALKKDGSLISYGFCTD